MKWSQKHSIASISKYVLLPLVATPLVLIVFLSLQMVNHFRSSFEKEERLLQDHFRVVLEHEIKKVETAAQILVQSDELISYLVRVPRAQRQLIENPLVARANDVFTNYCPSCSRWLIADPEGHILIDHGAALGGEILPLNSVSMRYDPSTHTILHRVAIYLDDGGFHGDNASHCGDFYLVINASQLQSNQIWKHVVWPKKITNLKAEDLVLKEIEPDWQPDRWIIAIILLSLFALGCSAATYCVLEHYLTKPLLELTVWVSQQGEEVNAFDTEKNEIVRLKQVMTFYMESKRLLLEKLLQEKELVVLGRTLQMIAHDLKRPMVLIESIAQLLSSMIHDPDIAKRGNEWLTRINQVICQAKRIIGNVLSVRGNQAPDIAPVFLQKTLETSLKSCTATSSRLKAMQLQPVVRWQLAHELEPLGDIRMLSRVFDNVISNGLEHLWEGEHLWLASRSQDGKVYLEIGNTGSRIEPAQLDTIFDPFHATSRSEGTGLGLYIAKILLERMGGSIRCDADDRNSVQFIMELPASSMSRILAATKQKSLLATDATPPVHLVVVDDDPMIARLWKEFAEREEYHILVYDHPDAFVQALYQEPEQLQKVEWIVFDFLFSDCTISDWLDTMSPLLENRMPLAKRFLSSFEEELEQQLEDFFCGFLPKRPHSMTELKQLTA